MVLKLFLKTTQIGESSSQFPRHFKTKERSKKDEKQQNSHPITASCAVAHEPCVVEHGTTLDSFSCAPVCVPVGMSTIKMPF